MKHAKDRVIAIDYFRGICILTILFSHSRVFAGPFSYLSFHGSAWASAAEFFFLLSGITFGIVRGPAIKSKFRQVRRKSWSRAFRLYLLHISLVSLSLLLAGLFPASRVQMNLAGTLPHSSGLALLIQILSFSYVLGRASFLMYYAVFMIFAPFVLYATKTRYWAVVPVTSVLLYVLSAPPLNLIHAGHYGNYFFIWQLYFFLGMTLVRFRVPAISRFYRLNRRTVNALSMGIAGTALVTFCISVLAAFPQTFYPIISRLSLGGWLPMKALGAYHHLLGHQGFIDNWLVSSRTGLLRPIVTMLFLAAAYISYQRYKAAILNRTGNFVNTMGRDTLWVFCAQAIAIPLMEALPISHRNLLLNAVMVTLLIALMWLLTQRKAITAAITRVISDGEGTFKDKLPEKLFQPLSLSFRSPTLDEE